jgi:hypothetical protein
MISPREWLARRLVAAVVVALVATSLPMAVLAENGPAPIGPEICQSPSTELLFEFNYRMDYNDQQWIADLVVWGVDPASSAVVTLRVFPEGQDGFQVQGTFTPGTTLTFSFETFWTPLDTFDIQVLAETAVCFKPVYREYIEPSPQFNPPGEGAAGEKSQACLKVKNPAKHPNCVSPQ